jgi:hypothetical protein
MHTTTGKDYLIVNGGIDVDDGRQSTNTVYVLQYDKNGVVANCVANGTKR